MTHGAASEVHHNLKTIKQFSNPFGVMLAKRNSQSYWCLLNATLLILPGRPLHRWHIFSYISAIIAPGQMSYKQSYFPCDLLFYLWGSIQKLIKDKMSYFFHHIIWLPDEYFCCTLKASPPTYSNYFSTSDYYNQISLISK